MLFTHPTFLFYFLPFALIAHRAANSFQKGKRYSDVSRLTIFGLTLVFYGMREPWWLIPFAVCIGFDFLWATLLHREKRPGRRKFLCFLSVGQNLLMLGVFKYWEFFSGFFPGAPKLSLPPGISFYTFESMSFVIDVYRGHVVPPKRPQDFFAFIGMFPRFVAGPIVRYREMVGQFSHYRGMNLEAGLFLFIAGFFLKSCFADSFSVFVSYAFDRHGTVEFLSAWVGAIAYTMQIYFDFSGYSLMAIGLGHCLGFQFPSNFNKPYLATSLQDFWRRWHMTLSSWLRDYLYIPLGGSRGAPWKTYRNLFLTMAIGGLWHGAGWTFLVWGAWHGIGLCLERAVGGIKSRAAVFLFVVVGWVFFRASTMTEAGRVLAAMFDPRGFSLALNLEAFRVHTVASGLSVLGLIFAFGIERRVDWEKLPTTLSLSWPRHALAASLFAVALLTNLSAWAIPFLYFQF